MDVPQAFRRRFNALAAIGRDPGTGGYNRFAWTREDAEAGEWFAAQAAELGLTVEVDRNGNRWAWWLPAGVRDPGEVGEGQAVLTGSHLDTVPDGGAYDGALGVVAGLTAVELLQAIAGAPACPVAVAAFADEEGARYDTPCLGSGLLAGSVDPEAVLDRRDRDGVPLREAVAAAGVAPAGLGPDPDRLRRIGAFVELHIEQGRGLVFEDAPVGVGTAIWPHGRWRYTFEGDTNHAGTTRMTDRRDAMRGVAALVDAASREAPPRGAMATVGRLLVWPNATNAVPGRASAWLDARAPDRAVLDGLVTAVCELTETAAGRSGLACAVAQESFADAVQFDEELRKRLDAVLRDDGWSPPPVPTAAGHDAGALAGVVPTGMLYVRNRDGTSHSPAEHADDDDCVAGIRALAAVLADLAA